MSKLPPIGPEPKPKHELYIGMFEDASIAMSYPKDFRVAFDMLGKAISALAAEQYKMQLQQKPMIEVPKIAISPDFLRKRD